MKRMIPVVLILLALSARTFAQAPDPALEKALLAMKDPRNNRSPVSLVLRPRRDFKGPEKDKGPDILVGYSHGYRCSWESPLGEFPKNIFVDNHSAWSGDHCMDYRQVPGILVANRRITNPAPTLEDLTVSLLQEFGIAPPSAHTSIELSGDGRLAA